MLYEQKSSNLHCADSILCFFADFIAVVAGGEAGFFFEEGGEIILVFKAQSGGDFFYRFEGVFQILRGQFHFLLQQIVAGSIAPVFAEDTQRLRRGFADQAAEVGQYGIPVNPGVKIFFQSDSGGGFAGTRMRGQRSGTFTTRRMEETPASRKVRAITSFAPTMKSSINSVARFFS